MSRRVLQGSMCLALAFGVALTGCFTPAPPPPTGPHLGLAAASWSGSTVPIVITSASGLSGVAPPSLSFQLRDGGGFLYFNGPAGSNTAGGTTVSVTYGDTADFFNISAGDGIAITFASQIPPSFGNGSFEVYHAGALLGHVGLPVPPPPGSQPSITLSAGSWNSGNTTFTVSAVANMAGLSPTGLRFVVFNSHSEVYYSSTSDNATTYNSVTVNVVYQDTLDAGHVSQGDSIRLSLQPEDPYPVAGGYLSVISGTQQLGGSAIP